MAFLVNSKRFCNVSFGALQQWFEGVWLDSQELLYRPIVARRC